MKRLISILAAVAVCAASYAQGVYTVIANPSEDASKGIRVNWHIDEGEGYGACFYTKCSDTKWKHSRRADAACELITAYDSLSSKRPDKQDFIERVRFVRNTVELRDLEPGTEYMYRFSNDKDADVRYFKTAPVGREWTAAVISDFHSYAPLPGRTRAAMAMLDTLESVNGGDFDFVLHVGDVCAWGGSYSFWRDLYANTMFHKYMWAGVNGNHDNMDRRSTRLSNDYFHYANNNPLNGYEGEMGVCYHFRYGDVLFVMLNNENMRSDQGLESAQNWVRKTIADNLAKFVVVMEHYQWFFGNDGRTSQYERWHNVFDECGVDLAIGANNHIYARTNAIYKDRETDGTKGTVYLQTPSSDNERGQDTGDWIYNKDKIKYIWSEGPKTVGGLLMKVDNDKITLTLYDRKGTSLDSVRVKAKR